MARPVMAAGVLYRDEANQILLVKPNYKDGWDLPGGYVEPGESPQAAAIREVLEELGVALPVGRLLVVDWAPHPAEGDKLLFVFDGGTLTADQHANIQLDENEIDRADFHPPEWLPQLAPDRLARRLALALTAVRQGETLYAEHGELVGQPNT